MSETVGTQPSEKVQTYGERAVGLSFNPSGSSDVDKLKKLYADVIDHLNTARDARRTAGCEPEETRLYSVAITEAQTAQMWAVKAATWQK